MALVINNKRVGDGQFQFFKSLKTSIDNKLRKKGGSRRAAVQAVRGTGLVGVLADQYEPSFDEKSKEEQTGIREHLQNMHFGNHWEWDSIKKDLNESYALQRQDIVSCKERVLEQEESIDEDADSPAELALKNLKELWPYLFSIPGVSLHHNKLTGRDITAPLEDFLENSLEPFLLFMISNSNANTKNLQLRLKLEQKNLLTTVLSRFLALILMVSNHFKEDHSKFIVAAEVSLYCV